MRALKTFFYSLLFIGLTCACGRAADSTKTVASKPAAPSTDEVAALKTERDQLVQSLNAATVELAKLRAEQAAGATAVAAKPDAGVATVQQQLDQAQAEIASLQAQVTSVTADRDLLGKQLGEAQDQARKDATMRSKEARAERDVDLLRAQNQDLLQKIAGLQAAAKAAAQQPAPAAPVAADSAASDKAIADLKAQLADTQDKLDTALRSYTLLQQDLDQAHDAATKAAADSDAKLSTVQTENLSLKDQLATATAEANDRASALTAAQQEITQLRAKAITQGMETTSLRDQLRQTQAQLTAFAEDNAQLKTKLAVALPPPSSAYPSPARPGSAAAQSAITLPPALTAPAVAAPAPASAPEVRQHIVGPGDTLSKISQHYYGTPNQWRRIYEANRDILGSANSLPMGASLRIP